MDPRHLIAVVLALALTGCAEGSAGPVDASRDAASSVEGGPGRDGGAAAPLDFVVQGCDERTSEQCIGTVPLRLTFIPVVSDHELVASWDLGDGSEPQEDRTVTHTYESPGVYTVTLTVSRVGGTASEQKSEFVVVHAAGPGGACRDASSCMQGSCVCGDDECQPALADGMCLVECAEAPCPEGSATTCVDLSVTGALSLEPWRTVLCLPECGDDDDCGRPGFTCRAARAVDGGWSNVCLPPEPLSVGDSCRGPWADLDPARCVGSLCLDIGAGGYCSSACESDGCPEGADCVRFSGDVGGDATAVCLAHCLDDGSSCDSDALLGCEQPDSSGELGFALVGTDPPVGAGYCAPRRCAEGVDSCGIGATCDLAAGGFCALSEAQ